MQKITYKLRSDLVLTPKMLAHHGVVYLPFISYENNVNTITDFVLNNNDIVNEVQYIEVMQKYFLCATGDSKDNRYIKDNLLAITQSYMLCRTRSLITFKDIALISKDILETAYIMNKNNPYSVYYNEGTDLDKYLFNYLAHLLGLENERKRCRN